jgi:N-acetylmuramoyl-L-alanine amidase
LRAWGNICFNPRMQALSLRSLGRYALALAATGLVVPAPLAATEVRAVRIWDSPEYTRAVFDVSDAADYKVFHLENPERIVLDVKTGSIGSAFAAPGAKGMLKGFRTGKPTPNVLRVVLDLDTRARPKSFLLAPADRYGHRLVIDLFPADKIKDEPVKTIEKAIKPDGRAVVVAVDPGHGGDDPGAIGASKGTHEKDVTFAVARALVEAIKREPGMSAFLTRNGDYFVPLKRRYEIAREKKADLFVSIHADANDDHDASGASVFMLSQRGASSEAARFLAERENQADLVGGVSLDDKDAKLAAVLLDLSQGATLAASDQVSNQVLASLKRVGAVHKREVQKANFVVLRSPDVPSILVETAFITNADEERKLNDTDYRGKLVDAILEGTRNYFRAAPPPGSYFALNRSAPSQHVVSRGETLAVIAQRHGLSVNAIKTANRLSNDGVREGDVLKLPTSS